MKVHTQIDGWFYDWKERLRILIEYKDKRYSFVCENTTITEDELNDLKKTVKELHDS